MVGGDGYFAENVCGLRGAGPDVGKEALGEVGRLAGEGRRLVGLGPSVGGPCEGREEAGSGRVVGPRWAGLAESGRLEASCGSLAGPERRDGSIVFKIHKFTKVFISHHSSSLSGSPCGIGIVPSINPNFFFERKAKLMAFVHSA
ncbi:hypothetical protein M9H77_18065 [Catharanthus roseus]|uniref:Uncharacterized protein n=1 Tax=Catharanthus roseus TaxID=4058 RepID=A0ACC0B6L4_CATRO|nr:hypothetical protein M9H77_18065 [Catharanthus roseus]